MKELEKIKTYVREITAGMCERDKTELLYALSWWASVEMPDPEEND